MPARYQMIANWVNEKGWTKGAELGVFSGATHFYLLKNCPRLELIGVDVWDLPEFREGKTKSGERCHCDYCNETRKARRSETASQMRARVMHEAREFGARSHIRQMTTGQAALKVADHSLDFVFIDGDHSTEGVTDDLKNWLPKIKPGGWLIGHDWNMQAVRDAVLSMFEPRQVVAADDHLWFVMC